MRKIVDTQVLNGTFRDVAQAETWLDTSLASIRIQSGVPREPFSLAWLRAIQPNYSVGICSEVDSGCC